MYYDSIRSMLAQICQQKSSSILLQVTNGMVLPFSI